VGGHLLQNNFVMRKVPLSLKEKKEKNFYSSAAPTVLAVAGIYPRAPE
jgi:hypothetical protein